MSDKGGFGFDPDDFDRVIREGTEGLRDAFERIGRFVGTPGTKTGWSAILPSCVPHPAFRLRLRLVACCCQSQRSACSLPIRCR